MVKTVPLSWVLTDTPGVCNLVIKTLAADHYFLVWTLWKPRKRIRNVLVRGVLLGRGFVTELSAANTIEQVEPGNTTTHTFSLLSLPPDTSFWYVLSDHWANNQATYVTPPVQHVSCPAPTITKSCLIQRDTAFTNNTNLEVQIPWQTEISDDYSGWPCLGNIRRLCVDDLSLWVDSFDLTVRNLGIASSLTFRLKTQPDNVIVWSESVAFGTLEVKHIIREVNYIPAAGSRSVLMTIQEPVLGGAFGWTLSYGPTISPIYHHNDV